MLPPGQRKKRLLLIAGVSAAFVLAGGGAYTYRRHLQDVQALAARERGVAAYAAGDYEGALDGIGTYILRSTGHRDVSSADYLLYAKSRRRVTMPNGEQYVGAMAHLRKALEIDPGSRPVQDELLDVYLHVGFATETLSLLESMLAVTPRDLTLLRTKCDLLEFQRQYPQALEIARTLHELDPDDFGGPVRTLQLMIRSGTSPENIDLWLAAVTTAHPNDARFDLLRAASLTRRQEKEKANAILDRVLASREKSQDSKFLGLLMGELDAVERFDDAIKVADQIDATADIALRRECLRRLWYRERVADLVIRAELWTANVGTADAEMLALRVLALTASGRGAETAPLRAELAQRTGDVAKAWTLFLGHATHEGPEELRGVADDMASAVKLDPESAILWLALGDARAALGETDAAIKAWDTASTWAPSWPRPLCRIADAMTRTGRPVLAVAAARAARIRGPNQFEVISTWMRTLSEVASKLDPSQVDSLVDASAQLRSDVPEVAGEMLPIEATLLVRTDLVRADALLRSAVAAPGGISEASLLRLAQVADGAGIALAPQLLDACERVHGLTPRLALARALAAARIADASAGLVVIDDHCARPRAKADPEWETVRATYMDATGHPGAAAEWTRLADASPTVLGRQLSALSCDAVWSDLAAVDRIIDRVKSATGEDGMSWRTARARRLLADPAAAQANATEAQALLEAALLEAPDNTSLHLLLARALERLGNDIGADEQLRIAETLAPDDVAISFEIARLAQKRGQGDASRQQIDRVLAAPKLTPAESEHAAAVLASQGDFGRSADLLQPLLEDGRLSRAGMILLAETRTKLGDVEGALDVCERIPDPPERRVLELSAELSAVLGRAADAQSALARLDEMDVPAADRELVRARIATHGKDSAAARDAFRRALAAAPTRADVWTEFLTYAVTLGEPAMVAEILADPAAAASEGIRFLAENRTAVVAAVADPRLRGIVLAALDEPANRTVLLEAARTVVDRWSDSSRRKDAAKRVQALADANLRVLAVQLLAADLYAAIGEFRPATEISARTMRQFPASAAAAQQTSQLLAQASRWPEAVEAGRTWKQRSGRRDPAPDLFLAGAFLKCDRAEDASTALEPYVADWLTRPDDARESLLTYLVTLARSHQIEKAADLLADLIEKSARWRTFPLEANAEWLGNAEVATEWLDLCEHGIPPEDAQGRLRLARAWGSAWERFGSTELLSRARQVIAEITAAAAPPADAHFFGAVLAERAGDLMGATRGYQSAIDRDPRQAAARNNLAMIQAESGQVDAAVENARRLVADHPRVPEFLDTLAYALRKARKFGEAKSNMLAAIDVDPLNPAWRIGLAEVLAENGESAESKRIVARVEEMAAGGIALAPDLRTRIDRLKTRKR